MLTSEFYQTQKYLDGHGETYVPHVPELVGRPIFGPRMLAMVGWLKSRAHCSYSTIETWMSDVLQVSVSRGYLAKLCNGVISASLSDVHAELKLAIPEQPQLGSDESSLKNNGKKHWIWCLTAPLFTLFHIASSRSRSVLEELIGTDYEGYHRSMVIQRDRFLEIVCKPPDSKEAANLTERFRVVELDDGSHYDMSQDYFRFMFASGVEPTNNHTEQQVRHCVIDRRITQGTRSEVGQRYHERMWTAIATCGKQGRSFFHFLHQSISANLNGQAAPSLLLK